MRRRSLAGVPEPALGPAPGKYPRPRGMIRQGERFALLLACVMAGVLVPAVAIAAHAQRPASGHRSHHPGHRPHHRKSAVRVGQRPCDIYAKAGTRCVAAFSSTRALFAGYDGPLYQVRRASDGATLNIGVLKRGGYADAGRQNAFCAGTSCVVSKIYDQTSDHNDLVPQATTTLDLQQHDLRSRPGVGERPARPRGRPPGLRPQVPERVADRPPLPHLRHLRREPRTGVQQRSRARQGSRGKRQARECLRRLRRHLLRAATAASTSATPRSPAPTTATARWTRSTSAGTAGTRAGPTEAPGFRPTSRTGCS